MLFGHFLDRLGRQTFRKVFFARLWQTAFVGQQCIRKHIRRFLVELCGFLEKAEGMFVGIAESAFFNFRWYWHVFDRRFGFRRTAAFGLKFFEPQNYL